MFYRGLEAEEITGATFETGKIFFSVKWKDSEVTDIVSSKDANLMIPQLVIQFYQDRVDWGEAGEEGEEEEAEVKQVDLPQAQPPAQPQSQPQTQPQTQPQAIPVVLPVVLPQALPDINTARLQASNATVIKKDVNLMSISTATVGDYKQNNFGIAGNLVGGQNNSVHPGKTPAPSGVKVGGVPVNAGVVAKKMFVCPYAGCSKSYNVKNYLIQHERTHTGEHCGNRGEFIISIFLFLGEKPFKCKNCGKGFSRVLDLKKHILCKSCY